jgi:hypothetical protein
MNASEIHRVAALASQKKGAPSGFQIERCFKAIASLARKLLVLAAPPARLAKTAGVKLKP